MNHPQEDNWREEFDLKFVIGNRSSKSRVWWRVPQAGEGEELADPEKVKDFISLTLKEERRKLLQGDGLAATLNYKEGYKVALQEVLDELPEEKKPDDAYGDNDSTNRGFNKSLYAIKAVIEKKLNEI